MNLYDPKDTDFLARWAYEHGETAIGYAERHVAMLLDVHALVWRSRQENPATYPGYCIEMTWEGAARRILGDLMAAGWAPPKLPEPMTGCDR